jgi:hypothetical protein
MNELFLKLSSCGSSFVDESIFLERDMNCNSR